jgi:hypothetical protein
MDIVVVTGQSSYFRGPAEFTSEFSKSLTCVTANSLRTGLKQDYIDQLCAWSAER